MIAYGIWRTTRQTRGLVSPNLNRVIQIIIESAMILTVFLLACFISYLCHSNLVFICLDILSPVIAIVFCLIIVRSELRPTHEYNNGTTIALDVRRHPSTYEGGGSSVGTNSGDRPILIGLDNSMSKGSRSMSLHFPREGNVRNDGQDPLDSRTDVVEKSTTTSFLDAGDVQSVQTKESIC